MSTRKLATAAVGASRPALAGIAVQAAAPDWTGTQPGHQRQPAARRRPAGLQAVANAVDLNLLRVTTPPATTVVSFRAHANGKRVTTENAGAAPLIADRAAIGS